ncbi:MAG TPA: DEAD/DEAH box helicase [Verrucomicrobiae bacterium]|nr:DEAD/DEAH box helicase [Verrucomicrobiae bacterium]
MAGNSARVLLEEDSLAVELIGESPLLSGVHRIYFLNVLGFDPSTEPLGYVITSPAPSLLLSVVDYLQEHEVKAEFNERARKTIEQLNSASSDLSDGREAGRAIKSAPPKSVEVPKLRRPLKPYQIPAVAHAIAVKNAANFSVPGSGKTAIVLSVFAILRARREVTKIIVIGPRSSFQPWEDEFRSCFSRKPRRVRISGTKPSRARLFREAENAELVLMSYQMANKDRDKLARLLQQHTCLLVLDESHNIKRFEGGTWAPALIDIGVYAQRRIILTGTPAPNSISDLWSQMTFLWPNPPILGTREQFKTRMGNEGIDQVREQLFPFYWRIRKRDLQLPKPRFRRVRLRLRPYQLAIYRVLAAKVLSEVVKAPKERASLRVWRTARMVRLLQAASNPALLTQYSEEFQVPPMSAAGLPVDELIQRYPQYEVPVKVDFAIKLARDLIRKGQKVLIWTSFVHNIRTLQRALFDFNPRTIYGDVPKDEDEDLEFNREKMIAEFRTSPQYPLLIANPSACAESVSLHRVCTHAIYLDRTFNAAHYMQSLDRIHRVGMNPGDKVQYYLLQSQNTIDEVIDERLTEKEARMRSLLDDDISVMSLDYGEAEFSEESEEDQDFSALIRQLQRDVQIETRS